MEFVSAAADRAPGQSCPQYFGVPQGDDAMVRTQIHLTEDQHRELTRYSQRAGISMAEAVRRCVDAQLVRHEAAPVREERIRAALAVCGKYRDPHGETRVAQEHDRYLEEAYRS